MVNVCEYGLTEVSFVILLFLPSSFNKSSGVQFKTQTKNRGNWDVTVICPQRKGVSYPSTMYFRVSDGLFSET